MSDELLRYYNSELAFLRRMGSEFAEAHSSVAAHLKLGTEADYDPHVGRMVQAFAYLNARTRRKLEDDFPEVCSSLLEVLYPHYLRPIPSVAITRFSLTTAQADMTTGYQLPRGTVLESLPIDGEPCRFRTVFPVTCWPLRVTSGELGGMPFAAPQTRRSSLAAAVLKLQLSSFRSEIPPAQLEATRLRFFIHAQPPYSYQLYELLANNLIEVAVANKASDERPFVLPPEAIQPAGFAADESLLDFPSRSFAGYRLLTEYFAFPQKFLFFDLELGDVLRNFEQSTCELYFYFNEFISELSAQVSKDTLVLGCTPIINLFQHRAEPIRLSQQAAEYRVIPDSRRPRAFEVYSVDRVTAVSRDQGRRPFSPFYSIQHEGGDQSARQFWHAKREWNPSSREGEDDATEVFLSFCDLDYDPTQPGQFSVDVETTCFNRNLPARLPFGGGERDREPKLQIEGGGPVSDVLCLTKPTKVIRPPLGQNMRWRLISHLSLNHISLTDTQEGAEALREILRLYDYRNSSESRKSIAGLLNVSSRPTVARLDGPVAGGMCRGVEVRLHFDEEQYSGGDLFLFASILDRFLGLYAHINSFTQTVVTTNKREGELRRWAPRAGEKTLL